MKVELGMAWLSLIVWFFVFSSILHWMFDLERLERRRKSSKNKKEKYWISVKQGGIGIAIAVSCIALWEWLRG